MPKQVIQPISLLKRNLKSKQQIFHVKSTPKILSKYKYKRKSSVDLQQQFTKSETTEIQAIEFEALPKTLQAYFKTSQMKNHIKPDRYASQEIPEFHHKEKPSSPQQQVKSTTEKVEDGTVYCICNRPYQQGEIMFKCEGFCGNWYHPNCINMQASETERQLNTNERWYCPECLQTAIEVMQDSNVVKESKRMRAN
ncbi:unnamed protein product [Blepharisma stoltei]|uniref:PHD-type domain-containing protein n=1 Tax=Blepharisma stoltei TaxID=1481888 RepID=A0AAU9IKF0_9CILI|nr:unnamed protein product [Blepharisma stoltei]